MPLRFKERFKEGGFRYLMEQGTVYLNAHYNFADTETATGHATLVTGANPAQHGIVSGDWWGPALPTKSSMPWKTHDIQFSTVLRLMIRTLLQQQRAEPPHFF